MPQFFITHVEPTHQLKGKEATFYIREQDFTNGTFHSHTIVKEIPHYFFTPNINEKELELLIKTLQKNPNLENINLKLEYYNSNKSFLRAKGSKEDRKILPEPFLCKAHGKEKRDPCSLNSPAKLLRWFYPPLMPIASLNDEDILLPYSLKRLTNRLPQIPLEHIVNDTYAAIDIETENWETGKDKIFMVVYASATKNIIFHDLPFSTKKYPTQEGFELIKFSNQKEIGQMLTKTLQKEDPLWIYGHNIMNFDQIKLRNLTNAYFPATQEYHPITKASQGLGRVLTKGRFTLDSWLYNFNYRNIFANNKLETIAEFEKSIDYEEQSYLVDSARKGNPEAFGKLVHYCIKDGQITVNTGNRFKEYVALKARHYQRDPDSICATGKITVANENWKRKHFLIKGTFQDGWKKYWKEPETFSLDDYKKKIINPKQRKQKVRTGFFHDTHTIYLTPFIAGSQELLFSNPILEKLKITTNPLDKFDLLQTLNAELSYLIEETAKILAREKQSFDNLPSKLNRKQEAALYCLFEYHGLKGQNHTQFVKNVSSALHRTNLALQQYDFINVGRNLHFVKGDLDFTKLENNLFGCYLGTGDTLSLKKEKIVANPFQETDNINRFVYQGINLQRGKKCEFEKRVLNEIITKIFTDENTKSVKKYLNQEINQFLSGQSPMSDYIIKTTRRTYYKNLLNDTIEKSSVDDKLKKQYQRIKKNIGTKYSSETKKKLHEILDQCQNDFSYPFMLECLEEIEHPFPHYVEQIYANGTNGTLLPISFGKSYDLERYAQKINTQFKDFLKVLK